MANRGYNILVLGPSPSLEATMWEEKGEEEGKRGKEEVNRVSRPTTGGHDTGLDPTCLVSMKKERGVGKCTLF